MHSECICNPSFFKNTSGHLSPEDGKGLSSPMALGGQRTAAVSPAGVIFHTTLEKLSSPHIS